MARPAAATAALPQQWPNPAASDADPVRFMLFDELATLADTIVDAMVPAARGRRSARLRASITRRLASQQEGGLQAMACDPDSGPLAGGSCSPPGQAATPLPAISI
jgi:hypothetical protein